MSSQICMSFASSTCMNLLIDTRMSEQIKL